MYDQQRSSPIIMQNENGPCPLVALVNTLVLSAPPGADPPLVRALTDRSEISSDRLLEQLADMVLATSGATDDVERVLSLLPSLHTGLNINPRFDGIFEESSELALFRVFSVDIVHGWLSDPDDKYVHAAVMAAESYEGAQSVLVEAQELSAKAAAPLGLPADELRVIERAGIISHFLASTATQLTPAGLTFLADLLSPGGLAVLFRNDHFSTIYKHPDSGQLFMLVTDAGFLTHKHAVWESLSDVSGSRSEFFSGAFVPVGIAALDDKRPPPPSAASDDYALAVQMQMREDERLALEQQRRYERNAEARRAQPAARPAARPAPAPAAARARKARPADPARPASAGRARRDKDKCVVM
ncbi:uncharacterized protein V1510DRAFT_361312 [Dipodascopsis tothii]|uniref:uncharacterized protein n=1 Tax=Dipodascopsis tothii TaxID=44089 RepID=UPI0034CFF8F6